MSSQPSLNDSKGQCLSCGRDNNGYESEACSDDCPRYWEEKNLPYENGVHDRERDIN